MDSANKLPKKTHNSMILRYLRENLQVEVQELPNIPEKYLNLLAQQSRTQRQNRQIFQYLRDKRIFKKIINLKLLIELVSNLGILKIRQGEELHNQNNDCWILIDGIIKRFQIDHDVEVHQKQSEDLRITVSHWKVPKNYVQVGRCNIGDFYLGEEDDDQVKKIAICRSKFFVLKKQFYKPIVETAYQNDMKKKQEFFSKIKLFARLYRSSLIQIISDIQEITYSFNKQVYKEASQISNIYIVKQGQFLLEKTIRNDAVNKMGKIILKTEAQQSPQIIKKEVKHYRTCPYKIINEGQVVGDCEYLWNEQIYIDSMKCHKEGSKLYCINAVTFFKKLLVPEVFPERLSAQLHKKLNQKQKQIKILLMPNYSNSTILKFMPNLGKKQSGVRSRRRNTFDSEFVSSQLGSKKQLIETSNQTFFQKFNKTIINDSKHKSFRNRKVPIQNSHPTNYSHSRTKSESLRQQRKTSEQKINKLGNKVPAVVQEIVQIVDLKQTYHRLRNLGSQKKGAFEFNPNSIPKFIRKKYAHILKDRM